MPLTSFVLLPVVLDAYLLFIYLSIYRLIFIIFSVQFIPILDCFFEIFHHCYMKMLLILCADIAYWNLCWFSLPVFTVWDTVFKTKKVKTLRLCFQHTCAYNYICTHTHVYIPMLLWLLPFNLILTYYFSSNAGRL